ncbi:MAG TPA: thiamine-phosphate kinase [Steroidobacteraceae bacterium]|jgi:thiamine-monophosphate kinase
MLSETDLIERFFRGLGARRGDVALGIGDDAALLRVPPGHELVLTTDALVEGVHFLPDAPAHSLGHRALAVNLSDLAAMGASACWALLSLNLPRAEEPWLAAFAQGFGALAQAHQVALVGGNVSRGPLSITVQAAGVVPTGQALRRDGAVAGDYLYVSGSPGDAAVGLSVLRGQLAADPVARDFLRRRFEYPQPRLELGTALRGLASACIDVSDGLYVDAQRLLRASGVAAQLDLESLPISAALREVAGAAAWQRVLDGGEDYELCFAASAGHAAPIAAAAARAATVVTRIGVLESGGGITLKSRNSVMQFSPLGFDHFRD